MTVRYHWFDCAPSLSDRAVAVLTVSRSHAVLDGAAFFELIEAWAKEARRIGGGWRGVGRGDEQGTDGPGLGLGPRLGGVGGGVSEGGSEEAIGVGICEDYGVMRDELIGSSDEHPREVECDSCIASIMVRCTTPLEYYF